MMLIKAKIVLNPAGDALARLRGVAEDAHTAMARGCDGSDLACCEAYSRLESRERGYSNQAIVVLCATQEPSVAALWRNPKRYKSPLAANAIRIELRYAGQCSGLALRKEAPKWTGLYNPKCTACHGHWHATGRNRH